MFNIKKRKAIYYTAIIATVTGGLVTLGNGCSGNLRSIDGVGKIDASSTSALSETQEDFPIIPGTKTISVVYSKQVLDQLTNCAGIQKVSDGTLAMYEQKKGAISILGGPNTITSPMLMAITSIAGEVCNDLLSQEAAGAKRIFKGMDIAANVLPGNAEMKDAISRLSLSCWQRAESDDERQALVDLAASTTTTRSAMLMVCTAMLSSLDSILN